MPTPTPGRVIIGSSQNFWLYSSADDSFDLTHPPKHDSPLIYPRIPIQSTTAKVVVDPAKTALVIIDMQNFFISTTLGRPRDGNGLKACDKLLKHAIPACRKAGIRIVWMNWGLTQQELDDMSPATLRAFGFEIEPTEAKLNDNSQEVPAADHGFNTVPKLPPKSANGKDPRLYKGLGTELGPIELEDGTKVDGGRLLMRDTWNAALYPDLEKSRQSSLNGDVKQEDVWIHKNRMSGFWGSETAGTRYLEAQGIKTLLFAGVNTDQCVSGSLQDAFSKGYDCLLLSDGSGTSSPQSSQDCIEFNAAKSWGFVLRCQDLETAVENMETG